MNAWEPEWSRDGLQVLFTGQESGKSSAIYRIFWDGTGLQKYAPGITGEIKNVICPIFNVFPLHTSKRLDFENFFEAVFIKDKKKLSNTFFLI